MVAKVKCNLDITRAGIQANIDAYQGDTASREILFTISNGAQAFNHTAALVATLYAVKPDGTKCINDCIITPEGILTTVTTQMLKVAGKVHCQLELASEGKMIACPEFTISVRERVMMPVYELLNEEPTDWTTRYTKYYALKDGAYTHVSKKTLYEFTLSKGSYIEILYAESEKPSGTFPLYTVSDGFYTYVGNGTAVEDGITVAGATYTFTKTTEAAPAWQKNTFYALANPTAESTDEFGALTDALAKAASALSDALTVKSAAENGDFDGKDGADGASVYVAYTVDKSVMYVVPPDNVQYVGFAESAKGRPMNINAYRWVKILDSVAGLLSINDQGQLTRNGEAVYDIQIGYATFDSTTGIITPKVRLYGFDSSNVAENEAVPKCYVDNIVGDIETLLGGI